MRPTILHVDMDAFFVSVERLYDPALRGKPVIVGGRPNQRGVVAAASYEARRFGVHSAMPLTQAAQLCPQAIFLPVLRQRYQQASEQVEEIFRRFSPQVEMVSVDEAYLNLTGTERLLGTPLQAAHRLHQEIADKLRLPCSVGMSTSRLVSKIASDQAKPNGILWIMPGRERVFLAPLPVAKIPGVGKATQEHLRAIGVERIDDLTQVGEETLRSRMGRYGSALFAIAAGDGTDSTDSEWEAEGHAKSLGHEETFAEDIPDPATLEAALADLSQRVAARLRDHGLYARTITLKLRYSNFQTLTRACTLREATQLDGVILETARELFRRNWNSRRKVRLLGVQASSLATSAGQANFLTASTEEKWNRALAAADRLRERFGFSSVQLGTAVPPAAGEKKPNTSAHPQRGKPLQ